MHNVYVQIDGYYSSQNGVDWEERFKEVMPEKKVITVFVNKKVA